MQKPSRRWLDGLRRFYAQTVEHRVTVYAAQASFFFVISVVPFIMLLLSLLQFFLPVREVEVFQYIRTSVPTPLQYYANRIVDDLYTATTVPLVSVTALVTLWISSRAVYALVQALNEIYNAPPARRGLRSQVWAVIDTLLLLGLLFVSAVLMLFGRQIYALLCRWMPHLQAGVQLLYRGRSLFSCMLMAPVFAFLYKALPNTKNIFTEQLPGAVFSTAGWLIFSMLYQIYLSHFAAYSLTYGSLTAVVLMMLWLYTCMQIFLVGAEINVWLAQKRGK